MKKTNFIISASVRFISTFVLLYFVYCNSHWSVFLSLLLVILSINILTHLVVKQRKKLDETIEALHETLCDVGKLALRVRLRSCELGLKTTWEHECQIAEAISAHIRACLEGEK